MLISACHVAGRFNINMLHGLLYHSSFILAPTHALNLVYHSVSNW
jgi:hypothetical protein